ncbi:hypothetical protein BDBG_03939 [Blastomyces gilchristii SLH14081]|uniref:Essential protein Yae1 N-terminal domain-containing protein n=1 Tax=Blastomyces gilchristii (strain SLH14081) TaxID=559298 RepID=A0A179ULP7_BLAGS|nr:uncharacterized protein BDBG_03939 [Blastomyces gilchristii SLH14081]OAT07931.1 hypothetical protein BDBG_03939 [Blastomyces gilchristii SLH14081]
MDHDLLDSLLDLEGGFYKEGYDLGATDGARSGYSEGSVFAVEKGFEKFQEIGRLYGKAIVWAKRLPGDHGFLNLPSTSTATSPQDTSVKSSSSSPSKAQGPNRENDKVDILNLGTTHTPATPLPALPPLPRNSRLEKHIASLLSLVDPLALSMENSEDAVEDFDERLKKAVAKVKLIERILGEQNTVDGGSSVTNNKNNSREGSRPVDGDSIEDFGTLPARMQQIKD